MSSYRRELRCSPVSSLVGRPRDDVEYGGKILLPPSVLESLSKMNISYPMLFRLSSGGGGGAATHCGVLEFLAEEGTLVAPLWVMEQLLLGPGDLVRVETVSLPVAAYTRFRPRSPAFLEISNPKAVLENSLRRFACLTMGDVFAICYNKRVYKIEVEETKPEDAVVIIECDMNVDFSPPEGYTEPLAGAKEAAEAAAAEEEAREAAFRAFSGRGVRLDGKLPRAEGGRPPSPPPGPPEARPRGVPDYAYSVGTVEFFRNVPLPEKKGQEGEEEESGFEPFSGTGRSLEDTEEG